MDYISFPYEGTLRLDDGTLCPIRWTPVPDNTPLFPVNPNPFRSGLNTLMVPFDDGAIGELSLAPVKVPPLVIPARVCNNCYVGDVSWWTTAIPSGTPGVILDADGWPVGCTATGAAFDFGWTLGFES